MGFIDSLSSVDGWKNIGLAVGIFLIFLVLRKLFTTYLFKFIIGFVKNKKIDLITSILEAFEKPMRWIFVIIGIQLALPYLPFELLTVERESQIIRSAFIILAGWGLYNLADATALFFSTFSKNFDVQVDRIVIPFVEKFIRIIVVVLSASIVGEEWGFNVNGFVAGLGLGGLAFALAAKDTVSNLFGGVVIITEKPFTIGDWIKTPSVEGVVEDITFRSTKVRTFAQALVTVPNATLSNEPIVNWAKMGKRQISFHLGLNYNTPKEKLETSVERIKQMLMEDEDIHKETIIVNFETFNESSLDVLLYFFSNTTAYADYLEVKEKINFKIMDILQEEGVDFAFPTRALVMQQSEDIIKQDTNILERSRG
ncbi:MULTISPECIES: mechanosensitive ion channel family protein [Bacillaceae]|uniref:mechanosensitive ion channel family protein n=1 Tax=Bacillaceae TaxID=186817 RepID=UPI001052C207|nr:MULTISPECIES: mechanosensitive ion channel family protein [Bacillaceae]TDB50245.1 mechanosensitive ion channel family protein [Bacillus sp. CBEL-1]